MRTPTVLLAFYVFQLIASSASLGQIVQVHQGYSRDLGWDHDRNRVVGTDMPRVVQDFGWRCTGFTGGPGEIGGRLESSGRKAVAAPDDGPGLEVTGQVRR